MEQRVDVLMHNGERRRATVAINEADGVTLTIGGIELMPQDYAMQGARVITGDTSTQERLTAAGWRVEQAGGVTVAAKLPRDVHSSMRQACEAAGLSMSAGLTAAARAWLAAGCPVTCDNTAPNEGSGQRGR